MAFVQKPPDQNKRPGRAFETRRLLTLLAATALLYGLGLGATDLWAPDEPRYGAIAEELRSGRHGAPGLILLHLNDIPYTQKPPLYFWLASAFGTPLGRVTELAARLPSMLAGLACVGLTAWIARRLLRDPTAALFAAGLLATSFRFAFSARRAQLDVLLTAFELVAVALFVLLEFRRGGERRPTRALVAGMHGALGLAALVKGPVGWLPLLVFAAYLAWEGRLPAFRRIAPLWAWTLSIGPIAVWILGAIAIAPEGFASEAVGENVFGRFFAGTSHARPFYYYAYQLPLDFLPWSLLLPLSLPVLWRAAREGEQTADLSQGDGRDERDERNLPEGAPRRAEARFLASWILVPLAFFSLSAGKRGVYLLPIFPALAVMTALTFRARDLVALVRQSTWSRRLARSVVTIGVLELAIFTLGLPRLESEKSPRPIATAAAGSARPGEVVGVYGLTPLEGGIRYYGDVSVESLRDEAELRRYLEAGGRLVILRARHFESLAPELQLREVASFRRDRRRLTLAERHRP